MEKRFVVSRDGMIKGTFNEELKALKYLQNIQPHSFDHATKHEGWHVETREMKTIEKIKLVRGEGPVKGDPEIISGATFEVNNYSEAREILTMWSKSANYDKTDFVITFSDGEQYKGTYLLEPAPETPDLRKHVLYFVTTYSGLKRPDNMSEKDWKNFLDLQSKEDLKALQEFYYNYDIHANN